MSGIRCKNTKPEVLLRRALHARGLRFRLHSGKIVGRPDLVFARYHAIVFVHGCFWHRHPGCRYATTPSSRADFWQAKFQANVQRDALVRGELLEKGWRVAVIWECALKKAHLSEQTADRLVSWLRGEEKELELGG